MSEPDWNMHRKSLCIMRSTVSVESLFDTILLKKADVFFAAVIYMNKCEQSTKGCD